jgi:G:T-mismatch repair DNA endonuclease (very short patch repair protein)
MITDIYHRYFEAAFLYKRDNQKIKTAKLEGYEVIQLWEGNRDNSLKIRETISKKLFPFTKF